MHIYVYGSSHVSQFCGEDRIVPENWQVFESGPFTYHVKRVGPSTSYNYFWRPDYYGLTLEGLKNINKEHDYITLFIGEIDCRVHIGRRVQAGVPLTDAVEEVVDRYFMCYLDLKQKGMKTLVFAIQPTSDHPSCADPGCPATGDPALRNGITREFNRLLERKCKIHGIPFISIFEKLMKNENEVNMDYFMDYVHLRGSLVRSMYEEEMRRVLAIV